MTTVYKLGYNNKLIETKFDVSKQSIIVYDLVNGTMQPIGILQF
jgi:hypothetical protein